MVWVMTTQGSNAGPGRVTSPFPADIGVRLCVYRVSAAEQRTGKPRGDFESAALLDGRQRAQLDRALAAAPPAVACSGAAGRFALLRRADDRDEPVYVELDGCRRIMVAPANRSTEAGPGRRRAHRPVLARGGECACEPRSPAGSASPARSTPPAGEMTGNEARRRFAAARVARLATADAAGRPHLVPMQLRPRRSRSSTRPSTPSRRPPPRLRRLSNVVANPRVAVLVDHYDERLGRGCGGCGPDGTGRVLDPADPRAATGVAHLTARYPQYVAQPPAGPVLVIEVDRWSHWSATGE